MNTLEPGARVRIFSEELPSWAGEAGTVTEVNGRTVTVQLERMQNTSALFDVDELRLA
jgi:hypothetical protein